MVKPFVLKELKIYDPDTTNQNRAKIKDIKNEWIELWTKKKLIINIKLLERPKTNHKHKNCHSILENNNNKENKSKELTLTANNK